VNCGVHAEGEWWTGIASAATQRAAFSWWDRVSIALSIGQKCLCVH